MLKVKKEMQTALVKKDIKMNENEIRVIYYDNSEHPITNRQPAS